MNSVALLDLRMCDGTRQFANVRWRPPLLLKRQLESAGATVTEFLETPTETWIDFELERHQFNAHNPINDFWLFVRDPACPDHLLERVTAIFRG